MKKDTGVCVWCHEPLTDGSELSGDIGEHADWMDSSEDFGCSAHPMSLVPWADGVWNHETTADVVRVYQIAYPDTRPPGEEAAS